MIAPIHVPLEDQGAKAYDEEMAVPMQLELITLEKKRSCHGYFGGGEIVGFQYQTDGELGWHITTSLPSQFSHVHDYWVAGGNFYNITRTGAIGNRLLFEIARSGGCQQCREIANYTNQPVVDISPAEKQVVLEAIADWEKPGSGQD
jgi:hypothetical protein